MNRTTTFFATTVLLLLARTPRNSLSQTTAPASEPTILDTATGPWRAFIAIRSPVVVIADGKVVPLREQPRAPKTWADCSPCRQPPASSRRTTG